MNILIEDADTHEYLTHSGRWTKKAGEGTSFGTTQAAFTAAKLEPIQEFNIVRFFSTTEQFVNMAHGRGKGKASA